MSHQSVSPPSFGMIWQRRIVYFVGFTRNVVSECQTSVDRTGLSLLLSSTMISGNSPSGRKGCTSSSPNQRLISTCCAVVRFWSRRKMTLCSISAASRARKVRSSRPFLRSSPCISAPSQRPTRSTSNGASASAAFVQSALRH